MVEKSKVVILRCPEGSKQRVCLIVVFVGHLPPLEDQASIQMNHQVIHGRTNKWKSVRDAFEGKVSSPD